MHTRIFNKMMAHEIEEYLARGGSTIYVAVGVTEVHGAMPVDCETIMPEACALEMAEQSDGLALINLPYFFPGGTIISNSTVQVSVRDSIDYLMMLTRSLVSQGFDKIIFVSGHGPAALYVDAVCRDFFQETKIHVCHVNLAAVMQRFGEKRGNKEHPFWLFDRMIYGSYKKMNQEVYLAVDPNAKPIPVPEKRENPALSNLGKMLAPLGGRPSIYFESPEQHGGGKPFASVEERTQACAEGEKLLHEMIAGLDLEGLKSALDEYHKYVAGLVEKYPRIK